MKILMVDSAVGNDYAISLCRGLVHAGVEVTLVTTADRESEKDSYPFLLLPVSPSKQMGRNKAQKLWLYLVYLWWLVRYALAENYDVVHFQFFRREWLESLYFPLLRLTRLKLVYTAHNILPHEHGRVDYILKKFVYQAAHHIIVLSPYSQRTLIQIFAIQPEKIHLVPHGASDFADEKTALPTATEARAKFGLTASNHVVLFFGYIRTYKGLDLLLEAFDIARATNPELRLIVAGQPHTAVLAHQYETQLNALTYRDDVIYEPRFIPLDEMVTFFTAADIVALPYRHIYNSGIIHTAYMLSRPVITTNVGDFAETIPNDQTGFVTSENTAVAFAHLLNHAFQDRPTLQQMGHTAHHLSQTKYNWNHIGRQTQAVYQTVQG